MTNGEKIKEIFPTFEFIKETEKDRTPQHQFLKVHGINKMPYMEFDLGWWNTEYKESTKALEQEPTYVSELTQKAYEDGKKDGYVQAKIEKELATKDNLGVDCISRIDINQVNQVIEDYIYEQYHVLSDRTRERAFGARAIKARINELQPVTLQSKIRQE